MNSKTEKWTHLDEYEKKYLRKAIQAYDEIMQVTDDIPKIASRYQLSIEDVQRAKDYTFGSGVSKYQFSPDPRMAKAWQRLASEQETDIDKVFLRHEVYESNLVVNQGINQQQAHKLTQKKYPWSNLLNQERKL